jgi:hypothetical protein
MLDIPFFPGLLEGDGNLSVDLNGVVLALS